MTTALEKFKKNQVVVEATAEQVVKDFAMLQVDLQFSGNAETAYEELYEQLEPVIRHFIERDFEKLQNVLYRIDISEEKVKAALFGIQHESTSELLTQIILKRELEKVVFRLQYSGIIENN